jgi:hypothetical protein
MPDGIAEDTHIRRQSRGAFCQRVEDNAFHLEKHCVEESPRRPFHLITVADAVLGVLSGVG